MLFSDSPFLHKIPGVQQRQIRELHCSVRNLTFILQFQADCAILLVGDLLVGGVSVVHRNSHSQVHRVFSSSSHCLGVFGQLSDNEGDWQAQHLLLIRGVLQVEHFGDVVLAVNSFVRQQIEFGRSVRVHLYMSTLRQHVLAAKRQRNVMGAALVRLVSFLIN